MRSQPQSPRAAPQWPSVGRTAALLCSVSLVFACGGGGEGTSGEPQEPAFGLTERVVAEGLAFPPEVPLLSPVVLVDRYPNLGGGGLTLTTDGSGRFFSGGKNGLVSSFDSLDRSTAVGLAFLDIGDRVEIEGEAGLLGVAFDPADGQTGPLYVSYVAHSPLRSRISRFARTPGNPLLADPASEEILFERPRTKFIHCGGCIAFGPDGHLYASFGDDTQFLEAQNRQSWLGKILRMTKDGQPVPGNPYFDGFGDAPFVWAMGLRNAWRFSFDRSTGDLWAGDVGEDSFEEINLILPGRNYGWPIFEGELELSNPNGLSFESFEPPVYVYPHSEGQAVIGGYVYRGSNFPSLVGVYIFGDFVSGRIFGLTWDGRGVVDVDELASGVVSLVNFAEDDQGELYASSNGELLHLETQDQVGEPTIPQLLSETGIFADLATLEPVPGVLAYDVVSPLWSDGAAKRRWIALPGLEQIQFDPVGRWVFPDGTVFVKHFELTLADSTLRRLETRVLWSQNETWQGLTYRWNDEQTDAYLLSSAETLSVEVLDDTQPGGTLTFDWAFPSPANCLDCHRESAGRALGVDTAQLNRDFAYDEVVDNQLRAWNNIALFTEDIGPPDNPEFLEYADPADPHAPLGLRARSYLAANCSHCHNAETIFPVMDLRAAVSLPEMNAIDVDPTFDPFGLNDPKRIKTFFKEDSVAWRRMETLLPFFRMPALGSNRVDPLGLEVIGAWADAGAPE